MRRDDSFDIKKKYIFLYYTCEYMYIYFFYDRVANENGQHLAKHNV